MYFNRVNNFAIISFHKIRKLLGYMMQSSFEHLNNFFLYIYIISQTKTNHCTYIFVKITSLHLNVCTDSFSASHENTSL